MKLTEQEQEELWELIAEVRDASPRLTNDADTYDIVDVVTQWFEKKNLTEQFGYAVSPEFTDGKIFPIRDDIYNRQWWATAEEAAKHRKNDFRFRFPTVLIRRYVSGIEVVS